MSETLKSHYLCRPGISKHVETQATLDFLNVCHMLEKKNYIQKIHSGTITLNSKLDINEANLTYQNPEFLFMAMY